MALYRKMHDGFWKSGTGKQLRGDPLAQVVALYLMTSPHSHMIGIYHCPLIYISHETGIPLEGVESAVRRLSQAPCKPLQSPPEPPFLSYDWNAEYVFVHRMAHFQVGELLNEKDNQVSGIKKALADIPNLPIKRMFLEQYALPYHLQDVLNSLPTDKPLASPFKAPPKPEAVTEAVTEPISCKNASPKAAALKIEKTPSRFDEFWTAYPKKVGRKDAARIWASKKLDAIADQIVQDVIARTQKHRPWVEGFVLNPSTYLRGERWTDAMETGTTGLSPHNDFDKRDYTVGINADGSF